MIAISVMVEIHPEFTARYREAVLRHANNSLTNEKGCVAFTVHVDPEDPNRFFLYEAYASKKDLEEVHRVAPYMARFRELTASWVKSKQLVIWERVSL